jgi:hypothetical protein
MESLARLEGGRTDLAMKKSLVQVCTRLFKFGGRYMDRTCDPCSVNAVLYR